MPTYNCCQSCGMPWDKDPRCGGTDADGSRSLMYCSYCYKEGAFVQPDWTAADMQAYATKVLTRKGIPEMLAKMLTKGITGLARWQPEQK